MSKPTQEQYLNLAFVWPALAALSATETAMLMARQFADIAIGAGPNPTIREPACATPNRIELDLKTVRLRDFSTRKEGAPTLLCAPFALHGAALVDLAPEHSLVAALRDAGLRHLFLTDWRSATPDMRLLGIDDYLADLNVLVDQIAGPVNLVGLCQGGWLSLLFAARFPSKVRKLVLAGAPIDIEAASSGLTKLVDASPLPLFKSLVALGDGRVIGHKVAKFWNPPVLDSADIKQTLQTSQPIGSTAFARLEARFREWYGWTFDLPGTYYLEVVERLYMGNELATGRFVALGHKIDLRETRAPLFLVAARDDEVVAPEQLFATERLIGTSAREVHKALAPGRHLGLFMGERTLRNTWPKIASWLFASEIAEAPKSTAAG